MTDKKSPQMPWPYQWYCEDESATCVSHERPEFDKEEKWHHDCVVIQESEARELLEMKHRGDVQHTYCVCEQCGRTVRDSLHRCPIDINRLAKFEETARKAIALLKDIEGFGVMDIYVDRFNDVFHLLRALLADGETLGALLAKKEGKE